MVDFKALIKLINTNGDTKIQKAEVREFLKTQNESIYTGYFKSIQSDVEIEEFEHRLGTIEYKALHETHSNGNINTDLNFKTQQDAEKYEQIKQEISLHDECYRNFGWKFKSDEDFELAFAEAFSKGKENNDMNYFLWTMIREASSKTSQKDIMERLNSGNFYTVGNDFQDIIFDDIDLSGYTEAFKHICFNEKTFANVSPEHLPAGFNPQEVLEKGKTVGLGIGKAHQNGYTGEGVSYAVIDTGTECKDGKQHSGLNFKDCHVPSSAPKDTDAMHGLATSYIAQEVAPNADCYYYVGSDANSLVENLQAIIDKNKELPDDKKIRVISMSFSLDGDRLKALPLVKELEAQGVWVFSSDEQFWDKGFGYLEKKDPNGDVDDINNYQVFMEGDPPEPIYVTSGDRTVPDPQNSNAYRHDCTPSASWAIPVVAGYYTLACQADPSMTPDRFMELARSTAQTITSTIPSLKRNHGTENTTKIKVIDINALLEEIERQKESK